MQVVLARVGSLIEISVADTGSSVHPEFIPRVFDLFRQADASTTRGHGGQGIGLVIVRQLAELHGGTISAFSAGEGKGTTFRISLPLPEQPDADAAKVNRQAAHLAAMSSPALRETDLSGVNILVVDDEDDARQLVKSIQEECNARVTVAESAGHALALLKEAAPRVLASDIGMPDMDGFELIRQVRKLGQDVSGIPAIALSASARAQDREQALQAGFSVICPSP